MRYLLQVLAFTLLAVCAQAADYSFKGVRPALVIDVRSADEYAAGHIPGAVNIPYDRIVPGVQALKGIGKESPLLVYCRSGRRSALAAQALTREGYRKVQDGGGMSELQAGLRTCTATAC